MMNVYSLLKLVHIAAVIIFLGNILTGLYWMKQADKTNNKVIISFTVKSIIKSDKWFTIPGVFIITAGGIAAAIRGGLPLLKTGWIFWSIILFTLSGIIFAIKVAPLQKTIYKIILSDKNDFDHSLYRSKLNQWELWGFFALLTPIIAMAMMILKLPVKSFL